MPCPYGAPPPLQSHSAEGGGGGAGVDALAGTEDKGEGSAVEVATMFVHPDNGILLQVRLVMSTSC